MLLLQLISILRNQLIDRNSKVSSVISTSLWKSGFSFRFNKGFRHFIVRYCNASLLRWHHWEESKLPVWPPSTVHGAPHLRLVTQNTVPVCKSFAKKTCPIVTTCTKPMLNYPSRRWGLESTRNSMYRSLCVLLEDLHEAHPWERAAEGGPSVLLLNSHRDLRTHTHTHKVQGLSSVLTQLKGIQAWIL